MTHGELGLVSCQLGRTSCWGECRERGETCLTYLSLTAPRLIVQVGYTPLICAAKNESDHSVALAKVLVDAKAEVNVVDEVSAIGCNRVDCHDCEQPTSWRALGVRVVNELGLC